MTGMVIRRSALLDGAGFPNGFCERSATADDLAAALGVLRIAQARQVHGATALEAQDATGNDEADALVGRSCRGPVAVGVFVADCVPVLVAVPTTGDVAAIHAGWRGIVRGVIPSAVQRLGSGSLLVAIGPCIGPCCFEVGADVAESIARACGGSTAVTRTDGDRIFVDLRAAVRAQFANAHVASILIDDVAGCTRHEPNRYHSFRREGAASGRMLAAVRTPSAGGQVPSAPLR